MIPRSLVQIGERAKEVQQTKTQTENHSHLGDIGVMSDKANTICTYIYSLLCSRFSV